MDMSKIDFNDPVARINFVNAIRSMSAAQEGMDAIRVGSVTDVVVTETGLDTKLKIYLPDGDGPFPVLFYLHGGGFILGSYLGDEPRARYITVNADCAVVSVDYALAPEHPWPEAINEVYTVMKWTIDNAEKYKIDTSRIAVGGSSSGGNIAATMCIMAHEKKEFKISYATLIYPPLDLSIDPAKKFKPWMNHDLTPEMAEIFNRMYFREGGNPTNPLVSPTFANTDAFPATSIFSAEDDSLAEEQRAFADKLLDANVETFYKKYPGTKHGFLEMGGKASQDCLVLIAAQLKSVFSD